MTAKEIWYVWDGNSTIPGNATRYIDRNGRHHIPRFTIPFKHSGFGAGGEIVAYTLGGKRERAGCKVCDGFGFVKKRGSQLEFLYQYRKCSICRGRGYIWKMGVMV